VVPDPRYTRVPAAFWAYVRAVSQDLGYSDRVSRSLRRYSEEEVLSWAGDRGIARNAIENVIDEQGTLLDCIVGYLNRRADLLEECARPNLMDRDTARKEFSRLQKTHKPKCKLPLNKQSGKKKHENYLVCIVNILAEAALGGCFFDADPQGLATVTGRFKTSHLWSVENQPVSYPSWPCLFPA